MPRPITLGTEIRSITAGHDFTCALLTDGRVDCWGRNRLGELGLGTYDDDLHEPGEPVVDLHGIVAVEAGMFHACALGADGQVWCWGSDQPGSHTPRPDPLIPGPTPVNVGEHAVALAVSGAAECWQTGHSIECGDPGGGPGPIDIDTFDIGWHHICVTRRGTLSCLGDNEYGQLGVGSSARRIPEPAVVTSIGRVTDIAVGGLHSCARLTDGTVWCWGLGELGQLGARAMDRCSRAACERSPIQVELP